MALKKSKRSSVATQDAIAELFIKLDKEGCDPITELARLAMDLNTPLDAKISIFKELAQYVAPKRRAVDVTTTDESVVNVTIKKYSRDIPGQVAKMCKPEVVAEMKQKQEEQKEVSNG